MKAAELADRAIEALYSYRAERGDSPEFVVIHPEDFHELMLYLNEKLYAAPIMTEVLTFFGMKVLRSPDIPRGTVKVTW